MSTSVVPIIQKRKFGGAVDVAREAAERGFQSLLDYLADDRNRREIERALRIRAVETALYDLFGKGKLHGTIHTCLGQEFSGAILGKHLRATDFVTSNHRCHGHFIGATNDWRGLIDEIVGNQDGVCAGIGSSQHLWASNFMSNGQQGGLLPVAAGVALDRKNRGDGGLAVSFLGEGTLGEGIVYETMNIDSLWNLPHVLICENNFYSQSTPQESSVAGSIIDRARAFGIDAEVADTWNLPELDQTMERAFQRARNTSRPTFIVLRTYRLNPHSKGDDSRDTFEIGWFRDHDPATLAIASNEIYAQRFKDFSEEAAEHVAVALEKAPLHCGSYFVDQLPRVDADTPARWVDMESDVDNQRVAQQLSAFYRDIMESDSDAFFLGEDIADPYGGAFKVSKGFTTDFPSRALTTPISEAAIAGVGIGLAISGRRPFVEIMFGDFITYAFDQIVNNASKMFHMYNGKIDCPVVIRAPMGGRRGYGPTHSQSFERFLIGIDNVCVVSLNSLAPVASQLQSLGALRCPAVLLENKSDYAARTFVPAEGFAVERSEAQIPTIRVRAEDTAATVTIVAYGGMARFVADGLVEIFERCDLVPELIAPGCICPIDIGSIAESVARSGRLLIVEEGAGFGSVGAEVIAQLKERVDGSWSAGRVCGKPVPIPSAPALETGALPSIDDICVALSALAESGR